MPILIQPIWLLLLVPAGFACWLWPLPTRLLRGLRISALLVLILAMCQPAIRLPDRAGTVVVVADLSDSMPEGTAGRVKEMVNLLESKMSRRDRLAVVSFGHRAAVERAPQVGKFGGFNSVIGADASNLEDGIETALSLLPNDAPGRILIVSDGKWTGGEPLAAAARAAGQGVPVDYRLLARPGVQDLAIETFQAPASVLPGEAYMITAWVRSPAAGEIDFKLEGGGRVIASGRRPVEFGLNRLLFRDRALMPGTLQYELTVAAEGGDSVPENNAARALVGVRGAKPILHLSNAGSDSGLAVLLRGGGLDLVAAKPAEVRWSLEQLSQFSAVILENVMASAIGTPAMDSIASWVEQTGSGLLMTGGKKSYATGGYFGSPLERILPVSMEMRREHRKLRLAMAVVLDRSGSMAAPVGGGKSKMDLANLGTAQVLDLLGPMDEIGVIAVDSSPHEIVALNTVEVNRSERNRILSIDSRGGGIFVYEALVAASKMILAAKAETKHIILFSDARDSEQPGNYQELLKNCREAGITVSVIGLGQPTDVDAQLLEDIARRGGGNIYFTDQPTELPRIFAQDTFTVARSTFVEEATRVRPTPAINGVGGRGDWNPPAVGGYNLSYLRPEATLAVVSEDEYKAPIVASWQAGTGRVLCYSGEADGDFAGPIAGWSGVGEFHSTLARWTAGEERPLPPGMLLTQEVRDGVDHIRLHLDPEREADPFNTPPNVLVLHGLPGSPPSKTDVAMRWKNADELEALVPIRGRETVLATVAIPGQKPQSLPPVCLPYSPEFVPDQPGRGLATLKAIGELTGGRERLDLAATWDTLVAKPQFVDVAVWLILVGLLCFLVEIFQRRTGLLARRAAEASNTVDTSVASQAAPAVAGALRSRFAVVKRKTQSRERAKAAPSAVAAPETGPVQLEDEAEPTKPRGAHLGALAEAKARARKRREEDS